MLRRFRARGDQPGWNVCRQEKPVKINRALSPALARACRSLYCGSTSTAQTARTTTPADRKRSAPHPERVSPQTSRGRPCDQTPCGSASSSIDEAPDLTDDGRTTMNTHHRIRVCRLGRWICHLGWPGCRYPGRQLAGRNRRAFRVPRTLGPARGAADHPHPSARQFFP